MKITFDDILKATTTLKGNIKKTPTIHASKLGNKLNCNLYLKLECLQPEEHI